MIRSQRGILPVYKKDATKEELTEKINELIEAVNTLERTKQEKKK